MEIDKFISYQLDSQFPEIYREDGPELIAFLKSYYEFLETIPNQSTYNSRRLFDYRDIDSTLDNMLVFFKNKFLNNLPFNGQNTRFIVKHILDLYRRKGTTEGIQLFFRLFYDENVKIHYPSDDLLKPSSSKWKVGDYLELFPEDPSKLETARLLPIYGSISGATAVIDRINYIIINSTIVPIIFLSNTKGAFTRFDDIISNNVSYGIVRGSLTSVTFSAANLVTATSNNHVGDVVDLTSVSGFGAKGRISKVSEDVNTDIKFDVIDGGFGFTLSNTDIIISNQTVFLENSQFNFVALERVSQPVTHATGIVIGQNELSVGIKVDSANNFVYTSNTTFSPFISTTNRTPNISLPVQFATPKNSSASANIGSINNVQTVSVIIDFISNFLNVKLNANNYSAPPALVPMSGVSPVRLSTRIGDAFIPKTFDIGSIVNLSNINPGTGYVNDVFVLAKDNVFSRFGLYNQVLTFDPLLSTNINVGDILVQNDKFNKSNTSNLDTRGLVQSKTGDTLEVMQLSLKGFDIANTVYIDGTNFPINILNIERDYKSLPLGLNATITGVTETVVGKIKEIDIVDSGFGFVSNKSVTVKNRSKIDEYTAKLAAATTAPKILYYQSLLSKAINTVATFGTSFADGQGKTEGIWESKTSHLNSKKVLQDSNFYQDFSYQLSSSLNPNIYIDTMKELVHVSGTKIFTKFNLEDDINIRMDITSEIIITAIS